MWPRYRPHPKAGCGLAPGIDHVHDFVPVHERGHAHGDGHDHDHDHDHDHFTGFDRPG
jgi:hypothetical protein